MKVESLLSLELLFSLPDPGLRRRDGVHRQAHAKRKEEAA